jgi:uncharacterized protein YecE (DUF72 family)
LPPSFKLDLELLRSFLERLPDRRRVAFEFRHKSWDDPAVEEALRKHGATRCQADDEDEPLNHLDGQHAWGYVRLHCEEYSPNQLKAWAQRLKDTSWSEGFVFFNHEGQGPFYALRMKELLAPQP